MLANGDRNEIEVKLQNGKTVKVSNANYASVLSTLSNQEDRKNVFEAYFKFYDDHKNTFANIYKGIIDSNIAYMKSKGYKTILSRFLEHNNIPDSVFESLINTVRDNTAPLKRYINLRKKFFNLKEYHTYDRFLTFVTSDAKYPYDFTKEEVLKALAPMGDDFVNHAKAALADGHVDVYPTDGKRSGAYSTEVYGYGAYILLNHTETLDSAFTLAHECGHSIHTLYSVETQPYQTKDYQIFVAEIPSTFNEHLFLDYLLKTSKDKNIKIAALEKQADNIVSTFYRQTLFANFEIIAHKMALEGKSITYDSLCQIMKDLYMLYYGIDLDTEPLKKYVWAYIPHLYNSPFYVYQYATCFSASTQLFKDIIIDKKAGAKEKYLDMLKAGGKMYPVDIVKLGGVDLTTPTPFKAVCEQLDSIVDQLETLLK
jgi:oligoendopeptidase F